MHAHPCAAAVSAGMLSVTVLRGRPAAIASFAGAAWRYWLSVYPRVDRELGGWRRRACAIPDARLRELSLSAQAKRGNMEGAAIFAAFAPRRHRRLAAVAAVRFQGAYNHLDLLGEQPALDPVAGGRRLHQALPVALSPGAPHLPYYEHFAADARRFDQGAAGDLGTDDALCCDPEDGAAAEPDDAGLLEALVDGCREQLRQLPSWPLAHESALRAAERVVGFQSLHVGSQHARHAALGEWAALITPLGSGLRWWETAAAAGSSLGVHVLIAAAASPKLSPKQVAALDDAYFPSIGALHSLLDNLVDTREDALTGQHSLIAHYDSDAVAAHRIRLLTRRSIAAATALPDGRSHRLALSAMAAFYLAAPEAREPRARPVREAVLAEIGLTARLAVLVFKIRGCTDSVKRRVGLGGPDEPVDAGRGRGVGAPAPGVPRARAA